PQACNPSHEDWLNDLSSTPPVSVTIATVKSSSDTSSSPSLLSLSLESEEPPQAAKNKLNVNNSTIVSTNLLFFNLFSSVLEIYVIHLEMLFYKSFPPYRQRASIRNISCPTYHTKHTA